MSNEQARLKMSFTIITKHLYKFTIRTMRYAYDLLRIIIQGRRVNRMRAVPNTVFNIVKRTLLTILL